MNDGNPQLSLRRAADCFPEANWERRDDQLCVLAGGVVVGSVRQIIGGPQDGRWTWSLTLPEPAEAWRSGVAATLDEAKTAFRSAWERREREHEGIKSSPAPARKFPSRDGKIS